MKIIHFLLFMSCLFYSAGKISPAAAQGAKNDSDVLEVQIPRPRFEIFKAWEYGGFWRWDEKDPRFFQNFLRKIHESLGKGPF